MAELSWDEIHELLRCALNRLMVIKPVIRSRSDAAALLIAKGYMQAKPTDVSNLQHYPTSKPTLKPHAKVWLTEKGRAAILALSPADFQDNRFWPLPRDVQTAQARVRPHIEQ